MKFVHVVPLFTASDTEVFEYFRDRHDEIDVMTGATVLVELPQTVSKDESQDILAGLESGRFAGLTWTELPCLWFEDGEGHHFVQPLPATRPALSKLLRAIAVEAPKASSLAALQRVLPITEESTMTTRVAVSLTIAFALLLVLLLVGFVWMLPRIHTYGTVAPVFAIYAVIGLLAAVVTFGILKSTGSLRGNAFGTAIEFGGAAAIFVAVLLIGMGYENRVTDFGLTLYFVTPNTHTRVAANGTVALNLPGMPIPANVNSGFATFPKVASSLRGQSFGVNAELTGYHVVGSSDIIIGDQPVYVPVAPDVPPPPPSPSRYQGPNGYFERLPDKSWVEHVSEQKGAQTIVTVFSFAEYQRDQEYIYLRDTTGRTLNGDITNVFLVRLPIRGGFAQTSWSKPIDWRNLYAVQAVSSDAGATGGDSRKPPTRQAQPQPQPQPQPPLQPSRALAVLMSRTWTLRVTYRSNEHPDRWSTSYRDVSFKFVQGSDGYLVYRANGDTAEGAGTDLTYSPHDVTAAVLHLVFTRGDFGALDPGVNCSNNFTRGARFELRFDSRRKTLGGPALVDHPDAGPSYVCGKAEIAP